ncbi:CheY-like receiver, AAA-type ATPase and DNA-binding domain-containing response regulator [Desulfocapsa sulfexigens DSM 10523]|uniref:CheY-like receiver, AAA-type ATPase and DNA-binding domain-containing response regulator n=1 Tax=Desulfocapsa sulfexigens (strain DSM 10523 / SB164P1) TaxID=1167006 RepID=M1P7Z5_DESSD|nr:sigma-54 dependent transcriptional regulator [Desulfocapsa sulfexigens]AGF79593.1 CheY-like receiver, AAA-type ATPase and DNA-binding domain-containing response regulator [Desulfocapsa sulfexigens DSM 10523]
MSATPTILFSDPTPEKQLFCLQLFSESAPDNVHICSSPDALIETLSKVKVDILFLNLTLFPDEECISHLDAIQNDFPELLIIAAIPEDQTALEQEILSRNTFFYITIPYKESEVQLALKRALTKLAIQPTDTSVNSRKRLPPFHGIIGETEVMQNLFSLIKKISEDALATVLIRGESGTGKEMVAKAIHRHSSRKNKNFVPVNCAAIPDDLLESELFGYTKGAFTGATQNKIGRIEYADGGTLFLDEIGDMKPTLQAKLLRVLQEKEFEPVGGLKATPVDTRVVAATHCDLEQLVSEGTFREDLYYRLSVIPLKIPPLKDRREDIPILLDAFLDLHATKRGRDKFIIPMNVMIALLSYEWKGNVRELENLVQQMSILYSGKEIQLEDLPERLLADFDPEAVDYELMNTIISGVSLSDKEPEKISQSTVISLPGRLEWQEGQVDFNELINDYESQLIIKAMKITGGNKKEAAKLLNLKRTTLLEKIKKKNLQGMWEEN